MSAGMADRWARHDAEWRQPAQIVSHWRDAPAVDRRLLRCTVSGQWWETLADLGITLLVSREYEHLLVGLSVTRGQPRVTFMPMPHPSGIAFDGDRGAVHVASTRNPNQVFELRPAQGALKRLDAPGGRLEDRPLVPVCSRFLPGCCYLHDLAIVGGVLYGASAGQNAIVPLSDGYGEAVWWPKCIDSPSGPRLGQNYIQLNSIAAGPTLEDSFFSASTDLPSVRRPGHRNFRVDRRGVIFSGRTREAVVRGLTRPHSARLHHGELWVDDSGYGQLSRVSHGKAEAAVGLPGWTRGLCFAAGVAFVGTSRVIPRFSQYAPGLDVDRSRCGLHAIEVASGRVLGSLTWPYGNQVFAVEAVPSGFTTGFPFGLQGGSSRKQLFYTFKVREADGSGG